MYYYFSSDFPAVIKLCAFNPFIPHDDFNSSIPSALFEWEVQNTADEEIEFALAFTVCNPATLEKHEKVCLKNGCGVKLGSNVDKKSTKYSDLCILTDGDDCAMQQYWYRLPALRIVPGCCNILGLLCLNWILS